MEGKNFGGSAQGNRLVNREPLESTIEERFESNSFDWRNRSSMKIGETGGSAATKERPNQA